MLSCCMLHALRRAMSSGNSLLCVAVYYVAAYQHYATLTSNGSFAIMRPSSTLVDDSVDSANKDPSKGLESEQDTNTDGSTLMESRRVGSEDANLVFTDGFTHTDGVSESRLRR